MATLLRLALAWSQAKALAVVSASIGPAAAATVALAFAKSRKIAKVLASTAAVRSAVIAVAPAPGPAAANQSCPTWDKEGFAAVEACFTARKWLNNKAPAYLPSGVFTLL